MRAVNTENEKILKNYKSEGRILQEMPVRTDFMLMALKTGLAHKNLFMNSLWDPENFIRAQNQQGNGFDNQEDDMLLNSAN